MKLASRAVLAALTLTLTVSLGLAQDKPAYEIKLEGDNIDNAKVVITENVPVDRSSAKTTVEGFLRFLHFMGGIFTGGDQVEFMNKAEAIMKPAERAVYEKIYTKALLDEMKAAADKEEAERKDREAKEKAEGKPERKRYIPVVTGEKKEGDTVIIEVEEQTEYVTKEKDGKWEVKRDKKQSRYTCTVKDGVWSIDKVEEYANDYSGKPNDKGEYPKTWKEEKYLAGMMTFSRTTKDPGKMPEVDTPEKLVRAGITWAYPARQQVGNRLALEFFKGLSDKYMPLFSERHVTEAKTDAEKSAKEDDERRKEDAQKQAERKIEAKENADGSFEVTVAPRSDWSGKLILTVVKTESGLRISKAGQMRKKWEGGKETEVFEPFTSPDSLSWN